MSGEYRAAILRDYADWGRETVRLMVREGRFGRYSLLMSDGTWHEFDEGQSATDAGLLLPAGSIEGIATAIAEYQGHASHADTEARVLREWLAIERERVDKALAR